MLKKLFAILKLSFVTLLFLFFVMFFGLPSFKLYLKKGILVSESTDMSVDNKIIPPAITICAKNKASDFGWKGSLLNITSEFSFYETFCSELEGDKLMMCINDETYSLNETVDGVMLGTTLYTGRDLDV